MSSFWNLLAALAASLAGLLLLAPVLFERWDDLKKSIPNPNLRQPRSISQPDPMHGDQIVEPPILSTGDGDDKLKIEK